MRSVLVRFGRRLLWLVRKPSGAVGLGIVALIVISVMWGSSFAPYDAADQHLTDRLQGPSPTYPLGTDHLGRDLLSRVILGTQTAMGVAVPAVGGALVLGAILGIAAGYLGRWVENTLLVVMDTMQSFPAVVLALALLAVLGPSMTNVIVVIGIAMAPQYARVARASVLSVKQSDFVEVERSLGAGHWRVVLVHIVPNIVAPLLVLVSIDVAGAVAVEAGLSFLGVGVPPPTPSWGAILADGFQRIREAPWAVIWSSLAIMLTTLGFTLLSENLRDYLDPRMATDELDVRV